MFIFYILEKYINDKSISRNTDDPKQEKYDPKHVLNHGMIRWKGGPMRMSHCQDTLRSIISMLCPWSIVQAIVLVKVDRFRGHSAYDEVPKSSVGKRLLQLVLLYLVESNKDLIRLE